MHKTIFNLNCLETYVSSSISTNAHRLQHVEGYVRGYTCIEKS